MYFDLESGIWNLEFGISKMSEHKDPISQQEAQEAVDAAYLAFSAVAKYDQAKIDRICEAMAKTALAESARLGAMACEETGFGRAKTSARKIALRRKTLELFSYLKNGRRRS